MTKREDTAGGRRSTKGEFLGLALVAAVLFGAGGVAIALGPCESDVSPLVLFPIGLGGVCVAVGVGFYWLDSRRSRGLETGAVDRIAVPTVALLVGSVSMFVVPAAFVVLASIVDPFRCWF